MTVSFLNRTLDQELIAVARGLSLECLVCGEFLLRRPAALACLECGTLLCDGVEIPQSELEFVSEAGKSFTDTGTGTCHSAPGASGGVYADGVKEFAVYTLSRIGLFVAAYAIVVGIYLLVTGGSSVPLLWPVISVVLLAPQRRAPDPDANRPL